jgi:ribosomal protein S18 acetylase RimI-like enzyme
LDFEAMRRGAEAPEVAGKKAIPAVAADLTAAFAADPMFDWFSRPDERRDAARERFFRFILANMAFGVGEIVRPPMGGAAAVWLPSEALGPTPLVRELTALPPLLGLTGWPRFGRLAAMRAAMDRLHPTDRPHDYLFFLGVVPEAQGHGIGSRLLRARTARLDAARRPAYLETATEANVRLYSRHGFEVLTEFRPRPDAPLNWSMWREPQVAV